MGVSTGRNPYYQNQREPNELAEFLHSRLKEWDLLDDWIVTTPKNVTNVSQTSILIKMKCASTMMYPVCLVQLELPVIYVNEVFH